MGFLKQFALGAVISIDLTNQSLKNLASLTKGVNEAQTGIEGLVRGTARAGAAIFAQLGLAGTFAAGGIAGLAYQTAQFDKAMQGVMSVGDTSTSQLKTLSDAALRLSGAFSGTEIGGAMEEMRRSGFSVEDTISGIATMSNVAQADQISLAEATQVVGNVWRSYGGDIAHVGDVLAKVSADTATNIHNLGIGVAYAGPVMTQLGVSLESTTAALGELSQHGIDGMKAGRGLQTTMLRLASPTDQMASKLKKMGFHFVENKDGMVDVIETLKVLEGGFMKIKDRVERTGVASIIFGKDQAKAGLNMVQYIANIDREAQSMDNVAGAAERMAKTRLDTPIGQLTILKNKGLALAIMMGQEFTPGVTAALKELVAGLAEVTDGFNGLSGGFLNGVGQGMKLAIDDISIALTTLRNVFDVFTDDVNSRMGDTNTVVGRLVGFFLVMSTVGLATFGPFAGVLAIMLYMLSGIGEIMLWIAGGALAAMVIGMALLGGGFVTAQAMGAGFFDFFEAVVRVMSNMWTAFTLGFGMSMKDSGGQVSTIITLLAAAWDNFTTGLMFAGQLISGALMRDMIMEIGALAGWVLRLVLLMVEFGSVILWVGSLFFKYVVAPIAAAATNLIMFILTIFAILIDGLFTMINEFTQKPMIAYAMRKMHLSWDNPTIDIGKSIEDARKKIKDAMKDGLDADAQGKGEQRTTGTDAPTPQLVDKRCLHIHNSVELDGKQVGKAMKAQDIELSERAGFSATPWQKRMVLEHGAIPVAR